MDTVLYLMHQTPEDPKKWSELRTSSFSLYQFPGVFLTIVTSKNVNSVRPFGGDFVLLFSPDLLKQKNYHINLRDYNGFITESITYYPWNADEAIRKINAKGVNFKHNDNEVVFHDNIPFKYLCKIIEKPHLGDPLFEEKFMSFSYPKERCSTKAQPDLTKLPFYVFPFSHKYTGIDPLKEDSYNYYAKFARVAGIEPIPKSKQQLIAALEKKAPYLHKHRDEQNIQALQTPTHHRRTRKRRHRLG